MLRPVHAAHLTIGSPALATAKAASQCQARVGRRCPSATNFILARPPRFPAAEWLEKLRARKILVRWFKYPEVRDYLRITIGTEAEAEALVRAARGILR